MFVWNRLPNHAYYGDEAFTGDSMGHKNKVQIYLPKNTTNIRNRRYSFNIFPLYVVGTKVLTIMGDTNRSKLSYTWSFFYLQTNV